MTFSRRTTVSAPPSRLKVSLPDGIAADVERAKAIHALLGEHAEFVERIRAEVDKQAVEHVQIQEWFDRLGASPHLGPHHVTWRPDYEPYYFEQLRKRIAQTIRVIDSQAVYLTRIEPGQDQAVDILKDLAALRSQAGQGLDVKEAPVVQVSASGPPERDAVVLRLEYGMQIVRRSVEIGDDPVDRQ